MANKHHSAIIKDIAQKTGKPEEEVTTVIDSFLSSLSDELRDGTTVIIRDFGSFKMTTRAARTGRNPQTGEVLQIPEKDVVTFKPSARILLYSQIYKK